MMKAVSIEEVPDDMLLQAFTSCEADLLSAMSIKPNGERHARCFMVLSAIVNEMDRRGLAQVVNGTVH